MSWQIHALVVALALHSEGSPIGGGPQNFSWGCIRYLGRLNISASFGRASSRQRGWGRYPTSGPLAWHAQDFTCQPPYVSIDCTMEPQESRITS